MSLVKNFEENYGVKLPTRKEVCPRCRGEGNHTNPAIDGNGITQADREDWADDDFMEGYLAGRYDVRCEECNGQNVVDVVNEDLLSAMNPEILALWKEWVLEDFNYKAEVAAERRMGA